MTKFCTLAFCALLLAACAKKDPVLRDENARAQALYEAVFDEWLARSPLLQTQLGIKTDYGKWDDLSDAFESDMLALHLDELKRLRQLKVADLNDSNALSYRVLEDQLQDAIDFYRWRHYDYPVNQMFGWQSEAPSVLINMHNIESVDDAEAYISRIKGFSTLFAQLIAGLEIRAQEGILAPRFVYPKVLDDCRNITTGAPFDDGEDSPIYADFKAKLAKLDIDQGKKDQLIEDAKSALLQSLKPAYDQLIVEVNKLQGESDERAGVWKFPDGDEFYNAALKRTTTTNLSADEIHELGLREVARIKTEMQAIMDKVGFKGSLQDFFAYMRTDPKFYFPDTAEGRQQYLDLTRKKLDEIRSHLDELFITKPKAKLVVKAVEPFREKSAGRAFYQSPPPDGSRPGIFYANLYNMEQMPVYELDALLYHEGIPGHHLQLSIATELKDIPRFRKFGDYTAYIEGWGLYAELLPKEVGLYQDPYADFGRLSLEMWRACRLVVDTGIHAKKWTREQAVQYLEDNTPNAVSEDTRAIERYIVMPSQATAYKIGMMKFLELRKRAQEQLGDQYDVRKYHEEVLKMGPLPLNILDEQVDKWIAEQKNSSS